MNNSINFSIDFFSNQILYEFNVIKSTDLLIIENAKKRTNDKNSTTILKKEKIMIRQKMKKIISFAQIMQKIKYDSKHIFTDWQAKDKIYIKLHKKYYQPKHSNKKFNKQQIELVKIVKKIKKLIYRLKLQEN